MNKAFICVGSNVGERKQNIVEALRILNQYTNISVEKLSSIYETKPFGVKEQPDFYNCAVQIQTTYKPVDLLMVLKTIEKQVGRKETFDWGPREIDLDLALYGKEQLHENKLILPHPGIYDRDFFLVPLLEIDEELVDPVSGKKLKDYLKLIVTKHIITKYDFKLSEITGS